MIEIIAGWILAIVGFLAGIRLIVTYWDGEFRELPLVWCGLLGFGTFHRLIEEMAPTAAHLFDGPMETPQHLPHAVFFVGICLLGYWWHRRKCRRWDTIYREHTLSGETQYSHDGGRTWHHDPTPPAGRHLYR